MLLKNNKNNYVSLYYFLIPVVTLNNNLIIVTIILFFTNKNYDFFLNNNYFIFYLDNMEPTLKEEEKKENNNTINNSNKENKNEDKANENIIKDQKYYNEQVKIFMNINLKDPKYVEKLEKHADTLFLFVDKYIITRWEKTLREFCPGLRGSPIPTEEQINSVIKDTEYQKVIFNDCNRTRVRESILIENFKQTLENIITYYCKSKNIYYKQGLNEIFGPLLLMKYKYKELTLSTIYSIGEAFIERFLPNYYYYKELFPLQCSLGLLLILIRYHEPSVYNILDSKEIIPEMYATNWIMTYTLGKVKLDILYNLWDYIIEINDPLFMHFFFVSMIINRREMLINCEKHLLPTLMASLTIISNEELNTVINKAKELRNHTPFSFRILANKLGFLIPRNKNIKENFEKYKPLSLPAMPIFPLETLYITNHSEIDCPDESCHYWEDIRKKKFKDYEIIDDKNINKYKCEKCDLKIEKKMKFFLLDCRILEYGLNKEENESDKTGYLPLMINVDQEELKSEEIKDIITKRYINERGQFHFIFLTTNTDAFLNFEEKFYKLNISKEDEMKIMYGLMEKKTEKELNFDSEQITKKQIFKLKEYDNLKNILKSLKKNNYPYIGFVYGGFDSIHEKSLEYNIELLFHNEKTCILCQQKTNQKGKTKNKANEDKEKNELYNKLWEHKKKIKFGDLSKDLENKTAIIFFGTLINYKNKNMILDKIQIAILLKLTEYKIEIYKLMKSEIDLNSKKGYYGLGLNEEHKESELIIFEEIKVSDILSLNVEKKNKNIINIKKINFDSEKDIKIKDKKDIKNLDSYTIVIDFASSKDSKNFINNFKNLCTEYRNSFKK